MRCEEEVLRMLRRVEELLRCPRCGRVDPQFDYDGDLRCGNCRYILGQGWELHGVWKALRWVLGLENDKDFEDYLGPVSYTHLTLPTN